VWKLRVGERREDVDRSECRQYINHTFCPMNPRFCATLQRLYRDFWLAIATVQPTNLRKTSMPYLENKVRTVFIWISTTYKVSELAWPKTHRLRLTNPWALQWATGSSLSRDANKQLHFTQHRLHSCSHLYQNIQEKKPPVQVTTKFTQRYFLRPQQRHLQPLRKFHHQVPFS